MKKILIFVAFFFLVIMSLFSQSFLDFKIPQGSNLFDDVIFSLIEKNDKEQILIQASLTCSLENTTDYVFVKDENVKLEKFNSKNLSFEKYSGIVKDKSGNEQNAELYVYCKDNIYLTILRFSKNIDDKTFFDFLNSVKILKKDIEWGKYENYLFSMMYPGKKYTFGIIEDFDYSSFEFSSTDLGIDNFDIYVNRNYDEEQANNIYEYSFVKTINGFEYLIKFQNHEKLPLSQSFKDMFLKGFVGINNQPKGDVIKFLNRYENVEPEHNNLMIFDGKNVLYWNIINNKEIIRYLKLKGKPTAIAIANNEEVYIADEFGNVNIYGINEQKSKKGVEIEGHSKKINQIDYVYGIGIVSCSDDKTLKIRSTEYSEKIPAVVCKGHTDAVACFDGNEYRIVSGSKDKSIIVWNAKGEILSTYKFFSDEITAIRIIDKNTFIAASKDKTVKIIDLVKDEQINSFEIDNGFVTCFSNVKYYFNKYEKYLAIGTSTGEIIVIDKKTYKPVFRFKDDKEIKLVKFYDEGLMSVNIENKIKYWKVDFQ